MFSIILSSRERATIKTHLRVKLLIITLFMKLMIRQQVAAASWPNYWEQYTWPHEFTLNDMVALSSGKQIVLGKLDAPSSRPFVACVSAVGKVDWSYYIDFQGAFAAAVSSQADRVWLGGELDIPALGLGSEGVLMELDVENGQLLRAVLIDHNSLEISSMQLDGDGNLVVAGTHVVNDGGTKLIAKFNPAWQLLNAVEFDGEQAIKNIVVLEDNGVLVGIDSIFLTRAVVYQLDPQYVIAKAWTQSSLGLMQIAVHPDGGFVVLTRRSGDNKSLAFYHNDGSVKWYWRLYEADYSDHQDRLAVNPLNGDIHLMADESTHLLTFTADGLFKQMIKLDKPSSQGFYPRALSKLDNDNVVIAGYLGCSNSGSSCLRSTQTYFVQLSLSELLSNCGQVGYGLTDLNRLADSSFIELQDVTSNPPYARSVVAPNIIDILDLVMNTSVSINVVNQQTLCDGNRATWQPDLAGNPLTTAPSRFFNSSVGPQTSTRAAMQLSQASAAASDPTWVIVAALLSFVFGSALAGIAIAIHYWRGRSGAAELPAVEAAGADNGDDAAIAAMHIYEHPDDMLGPPAGVYGRIDAAVDPNAGYDRLQAPLDDGELPANGYGRVVVDAAVDPKAAYEHPHALLDDGGQSTHDGYGQLELKKDPGKFSISDFPDAPNDEANDEPEVEFAPGYTDAKQVPHPGQQF